MTIEVFQKEIKRLGADCLVRKDRIFINGGTYWAMFPIYRIDKMKEILNNIRQIGGNPEPNNPRPQLTLF